MRHLRARCIRAVALFYMCEKIAQFKKLNFGVQELSEGDLERKHVLREQLEKKFAAQDEVECTFKPQVNQYSSAVQSRIRITSDPSTYLQVQAEMQSAVPPALYSF